MSHLQQRQDPPQGGGNAGNNGGNAGNNGGNAGNNGGNANGGNAGNPPQNGNNPPQNGNNPPQNGNNPPQNGNNPPQNGGNNGQNGNNGNGNGNGNGNVNPAQNPPQQNPSGSAPAVSGSSSSVLLIPPTAAAGGISMTQPPATATSYYKIAPSQMITFGWNMTAVLATPTHLTVSAVADNGNTYPVGPTDGIIPGTATQVVWDIFSYQQNNPNMPLAQGTYTLNIWDERGPGAERRGGYMSPFNGLQFALYTPAAYTPLASGWSCPQCHDAGVMTKATHPAFLGIIVSFLVIFLSGFHMLRTGR